MNSTNNKMSKVLAALSSVSFVPTGNSIGLNALCQEYELGRVRTFARMPNTDIFIPIDDARVGRNPLCHAVDNGFDFHKSLYQKDTETKKNILPTLLDNPVIHTFTFDQYVEGLRELAFTPTPNECVREAIIATMISRTTGVMGYITIELFESASALSDNDFIEIKQLLAIILLRIQNDETAKQLLKEESFNDYDHLTELPLLHKFKEDAHRILKKDSSYALLYLDIDKFKYINDIWSYTTGNSILIETAKILTEFAGTDGLCCRINDDKFGVLTRYESDATCKHRLQELTATLSKMQTEKFHDVKITYIGGAYQVRDYRSINIVLDKANLARSTVKGSYRTTFELYNQSMENLSDREKQLEKRTKTALENKEFVPYLQPKFMLSTNEICGAEALARWHAADRMIQPHEFIPLFERNGFITQLDFEIYEQTFQFVKESMAKGYGMVPISLNMSRGHINDPDFLNKFMHLMDYYEIPTQMIELEITESVFEENTERLKEFIADIRTTGIKVSIDDFGSAYSSLNMLKDIDVDIVKLDKSFIDNICSGTSYDTMQKDRIIVENIINMITLLGFKTIFEGIESHEQIEFLKYSGCNFGQGFLFARPLPLDEFENKFLKTPHSSSRKNSAT